MDNRNVQATRALLTEEPALSQVRRCGSSAMDSVYVASGTYDAYIDVGNDITGESFLAAASIALEAGGVLSDEEGKPLRPITNLVEKFSLVLSGNKQLHQQILARIKLP
jgi:myo-inositol-1(or 4)-monophosphatase